MDDQAQAPGPEAEEHVDGEDCAHEVEVEGAPEDAADFSALDADELDQLDEALRAGEDPDIADALERIYGPSDFFKPGGAWGGSEAPGRRAERIGHRCGLQTTSTKRNKLSTGSDHHVSQKRAWAVDLSNGSSPTPEMKRASQLIAAAAGQRWNGTFHAIPYPAHRIRLQLIYMWDGHYNHVHAGFRRT